MTTPAMSGASAQLSAGRRDIARATAALEHARLEELPLSELRSRHAALGAALDAAVAAAGAAGRGHRADLERLLTQRELHTLAGLSIHGIRVPTCPRASSLSALGPLIAGMSADPAPAVGAEGTRTYGLDLTSCIDGGSRAHVLDRSVLTGAASLPDPRPSSEATVRVAS